MIDAATLVGLACQIGTADAIEFAEFAKSLNELTSDQQRMILRGYIATTHLPGDASLERSDVLRCLRALRQAWLSLKRMDDQCQPQ